MQFKYVLGLWINYGTVNWERCCVMLRGCRRTAAVNRPLTVETHLQFIWFNSGWQTERGGGAWGGGHREKWEMGDGESEGGREVADRRRDNGRLRERENERVLLEDGRQLSCTGERKSLKRRRHRPLSCFSWSWHLTSQSGLPSSPHVPN